MRFRQHRGSFEDSIKTMVVLPDREALIGHVQDLIEGWSEVKVPSGDISVSPYLATKSSQSGWPSTFIVSVKGYGPVGFTDSDV